MTFLPLHIICWVYQQQCWCPKQNPPNLIIQLRGPYLSNTKLGFIPPNCLAHTKRRCGPHRGTHTVQYFTKCLSSSGSKPLKKHKRKKEKNLDVFELSLTIHISVFNKTQMGLKKKLEKYNKNDLKNSNLNQDSENLEESRSPVSFYKKKMSYFYGCALTR